MKGMVVWPAVRRRAKAHCRLAGPDFLGNGRPASGEEGSVSGVGVWATTTTNQALEEPSVELFIRPHPTHDLLNFQSLDHLVNRLDHEGYYGGVRLLMAICKVFVIIAKKTKLIFVEEISHYHMIPISSTGLSGSNAIVRAARGCLIDFYKVRELTKVEIRPNLVLSAEKELGIVTDLQDQVAQVYGGLVYMVE